MALLGETLVLGKQDYWGIEEEDHCLPRTGLSCECFASLDGYTASIKNADWGWNTSRFYPVDSIEEEKQMKSVRIFSWKVLYAMMAIAALVVASGAPGGYGAD